MSSPNPAIDVTATSVAATADPHAAAAAAAATAAAAHGMLGMPRVVQGAFQTPSSLAHHFQSPLAMQPPPHGYPAPTTTTAPYDQGRIAAPHLVSTTASPMPAMAMPVSHVASAPPVTMAHQQPLPPQPLQHQHHHQPPHNNRVPSPNLPVHRTDQPSRIEEPPRPMSIPLVRPTNNQEQPHLVQPQVSQHQTNNSVQNHLPRNTQSSTCTTTLTNVTDPPSKNGDVSGSQTVPSDTTPAAAGEDQKVAAAPEPPRSAKLIHSPTDKADFWANIHEFYRSGKFCDLRIACGGGGGGSVVDCHRFVLALFSQTMRFSLADDADDPSVTPVHVSLPDFSFAEVKEAVDRIYSVLREGGCDEKTMELMFDGDLGKTLGMTEEAWQHSKPVRVKVELKPEQFEADPDDPDYKPRPKNKRGRPRNRSQSMGYDFNDPFIASDSSDSGSSCTSDDFNDFNMPSDVDSPFGELSGNDDGKVKVKNEYGELVTVKRERKRKKRRGRPPGSGRKPGPKKGSKRGKTGHIDWEVKERQCDQCGDVFQTRDHKEYRLYQRHVRNHRYDKTDCNCGLTFSNTHQKKVHMWLTHSNGRYAKCDLCSHVGPTRTMAAHKEQHGKQSVCEVCGKEVAKTSQGTHWQNMHKEFQCPDCGEIIFGNRLYRRHRDRVHHEPFQCDQCTTVCKDKKQLSAHKLIMHRSDAQKPYHCNICGKGFVARNKVDIHMMNVHIKSRPYVCNYGCGAAYNDKSTLRQHEKRKHQAVHANTQNPNPTAAAAVAAATAAAAAAAAAGQPPTGIV